ncbi:MAG TPA: carbohydrate-binding protein [Parafilimonas sp.]|nr:carbohydrate-binding protein [Parafilimonas sp.]
MKAPLLLLLLFYCGFNAAGQTIIGRQLADQYPISNNAKTDGLTWLPADYYSTNTSYPLIIFLHAAGETGDGIPGLYNLLHVGLPRKISEGWDPQAVNPADGKTYQFIVVSPQAPSKSGWSYSYTHVKNILPDVIKRYRVDTKRIYLIGISAGGGGTWSSVTNDSNFTKKFAAILPVSSTGVNNPFIEYPNIKYISGKYGVKVWTVCGTKDAWNYTAINYVNIINTAKPAPAVPALFTGIPGYGHDTSLWKMVFDPSWRNNSINLNFYEWMLQYQRDQAQQPPPPNQLPVVDAGNDRTIILPKTNAKLTGSASDPDGFITSYLWKKISGPSQFTLGWPTEAETMLKDLVEGVYKFELEATDNDGATAKDTVVLTVSPALSLLPVVDAGKDQVITLPTDSVTLQGTAEDPDGVIISYQWEKIAGPKSFKIVSAKQPQTSVSDLQAGTYQFELTATDNTNETASDTVTILVIGSTTNKPPVANAGGDQAITLPLNTVSLSGSGIDADGTIVSYFWAKISGPSQFNIDDNDIAKPVVSELVEGTYTFRLTVADNSGATATDDVTIVVNPAVAGYKSIPGKIEAESYDAMNGVGTEITSDEGGGNNVGWINKDDWMDFNIYADSAGIYTVNFRIATPNMGARFQLRDAEGTPLAIVEVPTTGSYQGWVTRSVAISLPAGFQTLRIISMAVQGWNLNWMEFVRGISTGKQVPAKIEAEDYDAMQGVQMEGTYDAGGGLNVGWINNDDWMDYNINVPLAGKYILTLRVATPNTGAKLQVTDQDGAMLSKVDIPQTGGYQKWTSVSTILSLEKGPQTLRIVSSAFPDWNLNWLEFEISSNAIAQGSENLSKANSTASTLSKTSSMEVTPNPVKDRCALLVNSANTGALKIQVTDMQGIIKKEFRFTKSRNGPQTLNLSMYGLTPGMYVIRVQLGTWRDSRFILKQ